MHLQNRASIHRFILIIAATLTFAPCVQATEAPVYVYNSFGPGNDFVSYAWWGVQGASGTGGYVGHAEMFVPAFAGNLATLQAAVVQVSPGTALVNFSVAADSGGVPGAVLESFMNVVAPASSSSSFLVTMNSITQPLLEAGRTYWLCVEPAQDTTAIGWFVNNQGYVNDYAQEGPPGVWTTAPVYFASDGVFDVSVVPVPEPSVMGLALLGLGCFAICRLTGICFRAPRVLRTGRVTAS